LEGPLVPKRYEDEIRDLLRGMDRFPGEERPRRRPSPPSFDLRHLRLDARRLMGGALILMLFAWIMRGPWSGSYPWVIMAAGYVSLISLVLFVVALILLIRGGSFGGSMGSMGREQRWRGQVIELPRRGNVFSSLRFRWRRFWSRLTRGQSRGRGSRGRDSFQW
jgi:hypothetical protein